MHALSASTLLRVCELGQGQAPVHQALLLLQATCPNESRDDLAALPIGQRDGRLIQLRARTLGTRFESEVACPACSERLEFDFTADDVLIESSEKTAGPLSLQQAGHSIRFRLPSSADLIALAHEPDSQPEAGALLDRCIVAIEAEDARDNPEVADLPAAVVAAVAEAMAAADPQADFRLQLQCPACDYGWQETFDISAYLWQELVSHAGYLVNDVHRLASAYGWSEHDILAMSAWRRQQYLNRLAQ